MKQYALNFLASKGLTLDANSIDTLIETVVLEINNVWQTAKQKLPPETAL